MKEKINQDLKGANARVHEKKVAHVDRIPRNEEDVESHAKRTSIVTSGEESLARRTRTRKESADDHAPEKGNNAICLS